jgi:hypothetical protein
MPNHFILVCACGWHGGLNEEHAECPSCHAEPARVTGSAYELQSLTEERSPRDAPLAETS